ncbi:YaaC family protein [Pseudalkalibacillus salsuginis]|uniref:YaaC family protein n=1 Tax=Pseudalkalibacillus salsuginis TaxID=2910972 RepID=UPI001F192A65|nr:YaaC family protein [Pseudalkalibacillus salsuginis]MCF6411948.1 YaaC family protein [Pseudalkalibacillus salsuginis]
MEMSLNEWKSYDQFLSASSTQRYLKGCYQQLETTLTSDELSYRNCYSFIYYLTHGKRYFDLCKNSPLELQPVLLYYGMIQLIKCCLLTVDPFYPESTALLAHGVTTRKRKKMNYLFLQDEIKVQKNGLYPYLCKQLFHLEAYEGDKFQMQDLLGHVPEMNDLFQQINGYSPLLPVGVTSCGSLSVPDQILDHLHMTDSRFIQFIKQQFTDSKVTYTESNFVIENGKNARKNPLIKKNLYGDSFLPTAREGFISLNEVMVHYLLLYNLSMICRYETEWWGDLFHTYSSNDFPFISRFLSVSRVKVPLMLMEYLETKGHSS